MDIATFRSMTVWSLLLVVCSGSSYATDESSPMGDRSDETSTVTAVELGPPSNTGIPGAPRASVTPFTQSRPTLIDMDYLTENNGASIRQTSSGILARPGSFNALGDVNGDGAPDFIFSTPEQTTVVFGSGQRLRIDADGESFDNAPGFTLSGDYRFAGVGDINADGIDDMAMDTYDGSRNATGVRILFGRRDGQLQRAIETPVAGVDGFEIVNTVRLGDIRGVKGAGDFNADGVDDLLVGAFALNRDDNEAANAWVVYGSRAPFEPSLDVASLTASQGLTLVSPLSADQLDAADDSGGTGYNASITGKFDMNGDGVDDIAIGTYRFDWIGNSAESRTYVVYGSATRRTGELDLTALDGTDGFRIIADQPYTPAPDQVSAVGDIDGDGYGDLGLIDGYQSAFVFYAGQGMAGPVVDRRNLPEGIATQITDSSAGSDIAYLRAAGNLDGDAADELGIESSSGQAAIVYGAAQLRLSSLDLATPGSIDVTRLQGGGDNLSGGDAFPLVSLGDIDCDGIDDLGWGWSTRAFNAAIVETDDINNDGVADLEIGASASGRVALLRILYGFGDDNGFTGVLASTQGPAPIASIEDAYYDKLFTAMDDAARESLDQLNGVLASGIDPGPLVSACLATGEGQDTTSVFQFSCSEAPLVLGFDWGGDRYSGSGEAHFSAVDRPDSGLQKLHYSSYPPATSPGQSSNPFQAYVTYDASAILSLKRANPEAGHCNIDSQTRQTLDDPGVCSSLVGGTIYGLNGIFGADNTVRNLQIKP